MIGALLRKPTGLPVVTTVHSDYRLDYMGRPLSHLTFGTINALALRRLDYRIGVSDAMVDLLISRGFPPDRFYAIYNGIDFTPPPTQGDRLAYLRSLGADVDEDCCGGGHRRPAEPGEGHGHPDPGLCRGLCQVPPAAAGDRRRRPGEGQARPPWRQELGVERQVCFAGWISGGMDRFYSALDINALTSLSETFPYALTEGARFHLATVATAVGGIPYLIDQDVNGYLFHPRRLAGPGRAIWPPWAVTTSCAAGWERSSMKRPPPISPSRRPCPPSCRSTQSILRRHQRPLRRPGRRGDLRRLRPGQRRRRRHSGGHSPGDALHRPGHAHHGPQQGPQEHPAHLPGAGSPPFQFPGLAHRPCGSSRLYINGGGSLIQDVTSRRSLWFYLANIRAAKRAGNRVQMYGCGIGPVTRESHRRLAAKIINQICGRHHPAGAGLPGGAAGHGGDRAGGPADCGPGPDPAARPRTTRPTACCCAPASRPTGNYLCFALRRWKGFEEKAPLFGAAAEYAYRDLWPDAGVRGGGEASGPRRRPAGRPRG